MSDLPNGHYVICASGDKNYFVGRVPESDADAQDDAPKRVIALPDTPNAEPPRVSTLSADLGDD